MQAKNSSARIYKSFTYIHSKIEASFRNLLGNFTYSHFSLNSVQ